MYEPTAFKEDRIDVIHALIRAHPLATLVTMTARGMEANHIPMLIDAAPAPFGTLRGHVARANPVWREFDAKTQVLAVFQGPHGYVTPSWYPSKRDTGKVVPTWNYAVVHASGPLIVHDDAEWLRGLVTRLTESQESTRAQPWLVTDAPADYVDTMLKAIVGVEIQLTRLQGKWKMSQNRIERDRIGVIDALNAEGDAASREMAGLVKGERRI
jgi:transcriptional regulator